VEVEQRCAVVAGIVVLDFAEAVVAAGVGDCPQRRAGQEAIVGIAGEADAPGAGQETVVASQLRPEYPARIRQLQ